MIKQKNSHKAKIMKVKYEERLNTIQRYARQKWIQA